MPGVAEVLPATPPSGPPGDLIAQEQQLEIWRSEDERLLLGKGTKYGLISQQGLSVPPVRANDHARADRHGDTAGIDTFAPREVWVEVKVLGNAGVEQASRLAELGRILRVVRKGDPDPVFTWRGPGLPNRQLTGRPRAGDWDYDWHTARGSNCLAGFRFVALDPLFYDSFETKISGQIPAGGTQVVIEATNDGDIESQGIFEILGPVVNPRILNAQDNNRQLKIDITLDAGQTLIVDQKKRSITLAGVSKYGALRTDSQWFDLVPGVNNLTFSRTGTTGTSTLTVRKRSAYSTVGQALNYVPQEVDEVDEVVQDWTDLTPLLINGFTAGEVTPEYRVMRSKRPHTFNQRYYGFKGIVVTPTPKPVAVSMFVTTALPFREAFRQYAYLNVDPGKGFNVAGRRYRGHFDGALAWLPDSGGDVAGEANELEWFGPVWIEDE